MNPNFGSVTSVPYFFVYFWFLRSTFILFDWLLLIWDPEFEFLKMDKQLICIDIVCCNVDLV